MSADSTRCVAGGLHPAIAATCDVGTWIDVERRSAIEGDVADEVVHAVEQTAHPDSTRHGPDETQRRRSRGWSDPSSGHRFVTPADAGRAKHDSRLSMTVGALRVE